MNNLKLIPCKGISTKRTQTLISIFYCDELSSGYFCCCSIVATKLTGYFRRGYFPVNTDRMKFGNLMFCRSWDVLGDQAIQIILWPPRGYRGHPNLAPPEVFYTLAEPDESWFTPSPLILAVWKERRGKLMRIACDLNSPMVYIFGRNDNWWSWDVVYP